MFLHNTYVSNTRLQIKCLQGTQAIIISKNCNFAKPLGIIIRYPTTQVGNFKITSQLLVLWYMQHVKMHNLPWAGCLRKSVDHWRCLPSRSWMVVINQWVRHLTITTQHHLKSATKRSCFNGMVDKCLLWFKFGEMHQNDPRKIVYIVIILSTFVQTCKCYTFFLRFFWK